MTSQRIDVDPAAVRQRGDWQRSTLVVDGTLEVAVFEAGRRDDAAPVLLCVHGMGHWTQAAWDFVAAEFAATHRVVGFDLPGFGESGKPRRAYTLDFFARVLGEVRSAYAPGLRVTLVGHSLGGLIAALDAAAHPANVALLVLVDPAGFLRSFALFFKIAGSRPVRALLGKLRPSPKFVRRTFARAAHDATTIPQDYFERAVALTRDPALLHAFADVYGHAMHAFVRLRELHRRLGGYDGPTLLVWGREDRFVPVDGLAAARAVYPHARTLVIERCGHCPSIEAPSVLAAAIRAASS
ncbi:MAG: alpha/beta fold hydrolase [Vulcanimicrobiaceae bacterium]